MVAIDPNTAMQPYARENAARHGIKSLEFITGVAEALPLEDNAVDQAVCTLVCISRHDGYITCCAGTIASHVKAMLRFGS